MNKLRLFFTLLIIIILKYSESYPQPQFWRYIQVNPINAITGIYFYDSLRGWYVTAGMNPDVGTTTNGGQDWRISSLGSSILNLNSIYFINDKTGWMTGTYNVIRKTIDGGNNWIIQDNISQEYNLTVHFSDSLTGLVGGYSTRASIIKTSNGGENWSIAYSSLIPYTEVKCQHWINHDTGWFAGYDILLKTTDCGNTFQNYYGYFPPSSNGSNAFLDVFFINEYTGWVCGLNIDQKNLFKTTNGGYNWVYQANPIQLEGYTKQINGIKFINENTGWAVASALSVIKTTDAGMNWSIDLTNNLGDEYYCIDKNLNSRVWTGAKNGRLWYRDSLNTVYINNPNIFIPKSFTLYQNFPNPFNYSTLIKFSINKSNSKTKITIFDSIGKEIVTVLNRVLGEGNYDVKFSGEYLPSGIYFLRLQVDGNYSEIIKMVLLK